MNSGRSRRVSLDLHRRGPCGS